MTQRKILIALTAALLLAGCTSQEKSQTTTEKKTESLQAIEPMQVKLPEHLLTVLRKEMQLIENGMGELLGHIVAGRAEEAAAIAGKIEKSFILKQSLSKTDLKQLVGLLPPEFVKMDRKFHTDAGALAAAAGKGDFHSAIQLYNTMTESCVACHGTFAAERFPALAN